LGDCHFGQVFKKTAALALIFGNFFFLSKRYICINFEQKCFELLLGQFFTNSSGHPGEIKHVDESDMP
jgi:hypothetical protein